MKIVKESLFKSLETYEMKVVRWSTKKVILAKDLKHQFMTWGGFDATALSFCPYTNENDERFTFWKNQVQEHHNKQVFANKYILDLSNFSIKTEKELTDIGWKAYKDFSLEKNIRDLGIFITICQIKSIYNKYYYPKIVEFRLYPECKTIKIIDDI